MIATEGIDENRNNSMIAMAGIDENRNYSMIAMAGIELMKTEIIA